MQIRWIAAALAPLTMAAGFPAQACRIYVAPNLEDIQYADVIVIGRIADYRIVLDPIARRQRQRLLANAPDMRPEVRRSLEGQTTYLSDYARFTIVIDQVLVGRAGRTLTVTWDNSTYGEPVSMPSGPYLIALRGRGSGGPPLRGPSATILPAPEPNSLMVLQAPCSSPFLFETASEHAAAVRRILARRPAGRNPR